MIVVPQNTDQLSLMMGFLREYSGAVPTPDMHLIGWIDEDKLKIVVGLNGWMGHVCQIHVAFAPDWHFTPRQLIRNVFKHAFVVCKRKKLLGIVNSKNDRAMKYDTHLGFKELFRIPEMHDDDGDIVIFAMDAADCKYLESEVVLPGEEFAIGHA